MAKQKQPQGIQENLAEESYTYLSEEIATRE